MMLRQCPGLFSHELTTAAGVGCPRAMFSPSGTPGVASALCSLLEVGPIAARVGHDLAVRHVAAMVLRRTGEGAVLSQCGPDRVGARLIGQPRLAHKRRDIALEVGGC